MIEDLQDFIAPRDKKNIVVHYSKSNCHITVNDQDIKIPVKHTAARFDHQVELPLSPLETLESIIN